MRAKEVAWSELLAEVIGTSGPRQVGPNCTYKTSADTDGKWLNDLPSQRQYPTMVAEVPK